MKRLVKTLGLFLFVVFPISLKAQTLEESLNKTLVKMDSVQNLSDMMRVSAQFDMVAAKWENEWSSNYYAAYAKIIASFIVQDNNKKDLFLDEADKYLVKIKTIDSQNDETWILAALITNARIAVDGQNRGMQYGGIFNQYIAKAEKINPENPRIYYLKVLRFFISLKCTEEAKKRPDPILRRLKNYSIKRLKHLF